MNDKQRRFAEFYAANPNATEAARAAGYSEKTARSQGQRMLTNVDIQQYVKQLQEKAASLRIASMSQVKAFWSDTMSDTTEKTADRLKASELLAKSAGAFLHIKGGENDEIVAFGEYDGEDVVIYMPELAKEADCQLPPEDDGEGEV